MTFKRVLLRGVLAASCLLAGSALSAWAGPPTVLTPPVGEKAYALAGEALADVWEKVTGQRPVVRAWGAAADADQDSREKLPDGDLVLVGSDAVHPLVHQLIRDGALESLGIAYGSDEYRLLCLAHQGRRWLILAGGSGRSTLYAVYDFFRRQAGVEYFWDGDVIPRRARSTLRGST